MTRFRHLAPAGVNSYIEIVESSRSGERGRNADQTSSLPVFQSSSLPVFQSSLVQRWLGDSDVSERRPRLRTAFTNAMGSLWMLVSLLVSAVQVWAQANTPRVISGGPTCGSCEIQVREVGVLGRRDTSLIEWPTDIVVTSRRFVIATLPNKGEPPAVFDRNGRFVSRLGRVGGGPGEFEAAAQATVDPSDTLFITDRAGRLSVFSPTFGFVRTVAFPSGALGIVAVGPDLLVVNASINDRESVGLPFHVFTHDGRKLRDIGDRSRPYLGAGGQRAWHRIAPSGPASFWAVPVVGDYRIERWTIEGRRDQYFQRQSDWFGALPKEGISGSILAHDPPISLVEAIWQDAAGLLWVVTRVVDRRGRGPTQALKTPEGTVNVPADADRTWDSIIEVLNPADGTLVASKRVDELLTRQIGQGRIAHIRDDPNGFAVVRILQLQLAPPIPKTRR